MEYPQPVPKPHDVRNMLPRLQNAAEELLFGRPGPLRRRVCDAYLDQLSPFGAEEFPEGELRETFEKIGAALKGYSLPAGLEHLGTIEAAAHRMPGAKARVVAKNIFRLYTLAVDAVCWPEN
jgi:hypothetical protein